jgi:hypothetical protein
VERSGLVRIAGQRAGVPGRSARLYEVRPDAGSVLGLDIGLQYLRGALADLTGEIRAKASARARASSITGRLAPVLPEIRVSALGTAAVVDGSLASGAEIAWKQLMAQLPSAPAPDNGQPAG